MMHIGNHRIGGAMAATALLAWSISPAMGLCPPGWTCDCKVQTPSVPPGAGWATVHNPSFENGFAGGVGNSWGALVESFSGTPGFSASTLRATHGSVSQRIDVPECAYGLTGQRIGIYQQMYVVPGQTYTLTADVYMEIDQPEGYSGENMIAAAGLDPYGGIGLHEGSVVWSVVQGDKNVWRQVTVSATAVFEVMTVVVQAERKWGGFGWGRIWIDRITISGPAPTSPPSPPEVEPPDPDDGIPATTGGELVVNGGFESGWSNGLAGSWSSWSTAGTGYWKQSTRIGKIGAGKYDYGEADTVAAMNPRTALTMQMNDADYWGTRPNMVDTIIVGRLYIDHLMSTYLSNPTYYGRVHADNCYNEQVNHPRVDCWQGVNEPGTMGTDWAGVLAFEKAFVQRCHELGMKAVTLNLSVGAPGNIWAMLDAHELLEITDYVGYHSYGGPNDQLMIINAQYDPPCDYALRWRKYVDMYRDRGWRMPPVIYTEATTFSGWRGVFSPAQIRDDLLAFGPYMNENRWVAGMTLFVAGGTGEWSAWDIRGQGDIATACGAWNAANPSEATEGLYSQQFGAGQVHPTTLSQMQNPNAAFTGGIRQQITGLTAGSTYLLDMDFRYEFRGYQPQVSFHTGVDPTGQTSNPQAASILWSDDLIVGENAVHEVWERTWRTFVATGSTASIWIKASQSVNNPAYRISVDRVSVRRVVDPPTTPVIGLSPGSLAPTCVQGANAASQTFTVANAGVGTLSYSISDNAAWLACSPASGTSTGEADTITVSYTTSGLAAGTYHATITVSDPAAANSPQTIPVTLTVTAAAPTISRSPAALTPSCTAGNNAAAQTFTIANSGGGTLNYSITDNVSWLSCSPTSGTSTGEVDTINVTYTTSGLSAGTYDATITITASGATNSPQTIAVTLTVQPVAPQIPGDMNGDRRVNEQDVAAFLGCATGPGLGPPGPGCGPGDIDTDGDVDQADFGLLQRCLHPPAQPADPNCAS